MYQIITTFSLFLITSQILEEEVIMNNERHHDDHEELVGDNDNDNGNFQHEETVATLQFPIRQTTGKAAMKNISPSVLPHFHEKSIEDLDEFLFEFDIPCRIYDYTSSERKLKLFPATLKDNALQGFMSWVEKLLRHGII